MKNIILKNVTFFIIITTILSIILPHGVEASSLGQAIQGAQNFIQMGESSDTETMSMRTSKNYI